MDYVRTKLQLKKALNKVHKMKLELKTFDQMINSGMIDTEEIIEIAARKELVRQIEELNQKIFVYRAKNMVGN